MPPKKFDKDAQIIALLQGVITGVSGIKMPEIMKLDADQLREITATSKYGGGLGNPLPVARKVTVSNVSMTSANTEYSYTFPAGTVAFYMKLRSQSLVFTYAWLTGKLPTAGDGTAYMTTAQNFLQSRSYVDVSLRTIYFACASASQVMEIEVHTA